MSAEEWVGMISTFGDHVRLTSDEFTNLARTLERAIWDFGGTVQARGGTYLLVAVRSS
jgi:hypothetical protein